MKKRFDIPKNDFIDGVINKYSYCTPDNSNNEQEEILFEALTLLDDYERSVLFLYTEFNSSRKLARAVGSNNNYTSNSIKEIKSIVLKKINFIKNKTI